MAKKYYTDQERYEFCRSYKVSGMPMTEFCRINNLKYETFRDWMYAYRNLTGSFINVTNALEKDESVITDEDVRCNVLSSQEIVKKSAHFSRFDHSLVIIEYKQLKITTDVTTAERLLEGLYGQIF